VSRLFGTDGVRGRAGVDLTVELALQVATAAGEVLGADTLVSGRRPRAVVGRDPRPSGPALEAAVVAGLLGRGVDVILVGILPTPGVAFLTADLGADLGVMLSASHNAMPDNGIKVFASGGRKLSDAQEDALQRALDGGPSTQIDGSRFGTVSTLDDAHARYVAHLVASVPHKLDGLRVVVDAANGAGATVAAAALEAAGAQVVALHHQLDGLTINDACGSTHPESLQRAVVEHQADAGIALDGDADRCLAVDATGRLVDGDQIMAILATAQHARGELTHGTLVATVMSNVALHQVARERGITLLTTAVGDRYVLEAMADGGFTLGGEQSGHVVMAKHATTGDGVLTALHLLSEVAAQRQTLAELASILTPLPQVLVNVAGVDRVALPDSIVVGEAVRVAEEQLGDAGRVLLRASGTEPLIRVMVEAATIEQAQRIADDLAEVVRAELSL
jgi:phosphoglucosamine mutase